MITLYHFTPEEFTRGGTAWFPRMDSRLLVLLDVFRFRWGRQVTISPHPAAVGRIGAMNELSDHNVTLHGRVLAVDVMPYGMENEVEAGRAVSWARDIGFTAIGVYPDWQPSPGLHLGCRPGRVPGDPAVWGAVRDGGAQRYVALDLAMRKLSA